LNEDAVALMLLAVQTRDLELGINVAVKRVNHISFNNRDTRDVIRTCLFSFPQIWAPELYFDLDHELEDLENDDERIYWARPWRFIPHRNSNQLTSHVMSFMTVKMHTPAGNSIYHFRLAIILIFKHAAVLALSGIRANLALTQAESDYRKAKIGSKIEEHFTAPYSEYTVEQLINFLKNTNIGVVSH